MATIDDVSPDAVAAAQVESKLLRRIDRVAERVGDAVNPILIKETRQALKSRQFLVTFSALLLAALGWTIAGSLSLGIEIYTNPSAPRMLIGYYIVLAIPLLLVVPLAAYRSLEGEIDDGTLELLSITSLSPWQIVLGKLASASLQMMLYFVVLLPCVAYAYTLRGVDLPTTLLMVGVLLMSALLLTILALFFAPLAQSRTGRIGTLLACIAILIGAQWCIGYLVIQVMILDGIALVTDVLVFISVAVVLMTICIGHLLLTATAAQLTPESENRSTPLRLSLLMLTTVAIGLAAYGIQHEDMDVAMFSFLITTFGLAVLWTVAGSMMVAESSVMTPRIRRELPNSFVARLLLTWITPGPSTGLVFTTIVAVSLGGLFLGTFELIAEWQPRLGGAGRARGALYQMTLLYLGYLVSFLVAVRLIVKLARIKSNPRADIGIAAMIVVLVTSALVPYVIGLQINDYRDYDYSYLQITNWVWTLGRAIDWRLSNNEEYVVAGFALILFTASLVTMRDIVLPRRIATPKRVTEEKDKKKAGV